MAIRWGIIGCGDVCEVKSGPAFQKCAGSELVAVMRRDAAKAEDYARRHGVPKWYSDAEKLIADPEVDAVYVATPVGSHLEYALKVAEAGKPCYVEKPMARSHAECARMVEAFTRARQPLFIAYYRRKLPRFEKVKELVDGGTLGTVTAVSVRYTSDAQRDRREDSPAGAQWRLDAEQSGGGIFMDLASHTLDVLDHILGAVAEVKGFATNRAGAYDVEDAVAMQFRYESGAVGAGLWDFASPVREDVIEIHGTRGRVSLSTFGNDPVKLELPAEGQGSLQQFDLPNPPHVHQPLVQTIVDELNGKAAACCPSTGASAARTAKVMDAALEAYYGGREDAFWARPGTWPGRRRG